MRGPTKKKSKENEKRRRRKRENKEKNGVLLILVSNLHVTENRRRLEEHSPAQICKIMNRKSCK